MTKLVPTTLHLRTLLIESSQVLEINTVLTRSAGMAELADAADSKSADPCGHGGSTPPPGTIIQRNYDEISPS